MDMTWFDELEAKIPKGTVRTRFAPSPTGYMHVGNLRTALYTWLIARKAGGQFIFRLEDTDQTRQVEGATELIYRTMAECGLTHDEGPDVGGPVGPYIQTQRRGLYGKFAELLVEKGHAYYCFCEKAESEEDSGDFDRAEDPCRCLSQQEVAAQLAAGKPYVIRQKIPHTGTTTFSDASFGEITVENSTLDDQVLMKRDGLPTYNFANVIDRFGSFAVVVCRFVVSLTIISWALPMWFGAANTSPPLPSITCSTRPLGGKFPPTFTVPPSCGMPSTRCPSAMGTPLTRT